MQRHAYQGAGIRGFQDEDVAVFGESGIYQTAGAHGSVYGGDAPGFHCPHQGSQRGFVEEKGSVHIHAADEAGAFQRQVGFQQLGADGGIAGHTHMIARAVGKGLGNEYADIVLGQVKSGGIAGAFNSIYADAELFEKAGVVI